MITEVKLVNRNKSDFVDRTAFNGSADFDFDEYGEPIRCNSGEAFEQNLLKSILTSRQEEDGYGTRFKSVIGRSNTNFIRVALMSDVTTSLAVLKKYQLEYSGKNPTLDKKTVIGELVNLKGNSVSSTSFEVSAKLRTLDDIEKNSDKLQEVNTILE